MSEVYVKRGALCTAEPYDPARDDQGVSVNRDENGEVISRTINAFGRMTNVRIGDMIVTDDRGSWACSPYSFAGLYQPLSELVTPAALVTPDAAPETVPAATGEPTQ